VRITITGLPTFPHPHPRTGNRTRQGIVGMMADIIGATLHTPQRLPDAVALLGVIW